MTQSSGDAEKLISIKDFQDLIRKMYYEKDAARGAEATFLWLMEEVGELASALRKAETLEGTPEAENARKNLEGEFADVLGWLSTLANMHGIDLQEALQKKYLDHPDRPHKA